MVHDKTDAVQPPGPPDELVAELLRASRVLVGVATRSLAEVDHVVTLTQFRTLVVLGTHRDSRLTTLAGLLQVNASTAQRMVDRLVTADLVTRDVNPDNRREVVLGLTDEGKRIVDVVTRRRARDIDLVARELPTALRSDFVAALRLFSTAAGEPTLPPASDSAWGP